jgi:hypothetical protein
MLVFHIIFGLIEISRKEPTRANEKFLAGVHPG